VPDDLPPEELYLFRGKQAETHLSITHLEILHAVEESLARHPHRRLPPSEQSFFYFRDPASLPPPETVPEPHREHYERTFFEHLPERRQMLAELKAWVRRKLEGKERVFDYRGRWDPDGENPEDDLLYSRLTHLDQFGERVEADLKRGIESAFAGHIASYGPVDPLAEERGPHEAFVEHRTQVHLARREVELALTQYVEDNDPRPLLLSGPPGAGKSSVLAHWLRDQPAGVFTVARFIGASPASTQLVRLLANLCGELIRFFDLDETLPDDQDLSAVEQKWLRILTQAGERGRVLTTDPWMQSYAGGTGCLLYKARWRLLAGDSTEAVRLFRTSQTSEPGAARQWLDYGRALHQSGTAAEARAAWEMGLGCHDERTNEVWKRQLRELLS
jgi:hypothetical protein